MDYNDDGTKWGSRRRIETALAAFGAGIFEWICLEAIFSGRYSEDSCARKLWIDIPFEGMRVGSLYLPDATPSKLNRAYSRLDQTGLVRRVDQELASAIISEQQAYSECTTPIESLVGRRVLTELGIRAWVTIKELEGYFERRRFIKLLSRESHGQLIVFHSVFPYDLELLCSDCAEIERTDYSKQLVGVGPWFSSGVAWLSGWRLQCPHILQ